jgi:hypothetical protein
VRNGKKKVSVSGRDERNRESRRGVINVEREGGKRERTGGEERVE